MDAKGTLRKVKFLICSNCGNIYFLDEDLSHLNVDKIELDFETMAFGSIEFNKSSNRFEVNEVWSNDRFTITVSCDACRNEDYIEMYISPRVLTDASGLQDFDEIIRDSVLVEAEVDFKNKKILKVRAGEDVDYSEPKLIKLLKDVLF